ncbi:MAG: PrsW family intramembrane metalloprotease [Bacteroidetes bacterium]|nr:PrsW family intramembrane metalloprotease [Bacteroidota bacterium]
MILLALAIAPGLAISIYIYWKDKFDREPARLLMLAFVLGMISTVPAFFIEVLVSRLGLEVSQDLLTTGVRTFIGVAAVEELCKFYFVFRYLYRKPDFNEPFDGITYSVMVSMGFATLENIAYVMQHGMDVAILRMFTAVPAHATFGIIMGYFLGLAKFRHEESNRLILYSVMVPVLFHGWYDFALIQTFYDDIMLKFGGAVASLVLGIILSRSAIRLHQKNSPFRIKKE